MKLEQVPLEWIHRALERVSPLVEKATVYEGCDLTPEYIKVMLGQGVWHLLLVTDTEVVGIIVVSFANRCRNRVASIIAMGGRNIVTPELFEQGKAFAAANGATSIEVSARKSAARLYKRVGFLEKHRTLEVKL